MLYYLGHLIAICSIYYWLTILFPGTTQKHYNIAIASVLYSVIMIGFGALFSRGIQALSPELKPVHARTLLTFVVIIIILVPHVILFFTGFYDQPGDRFSYWLILNPFATISLMISDVDTPHLIAILSGLAVLFMLLNIMPMIASLRQTIHSKQVLAHSAGEGHVVKLS